MVIRFLRDSGTQSVCAIGGLGVAVAAIGVGLLLAIEKGDVRILGWALVGVGSFAAVASLLLLGVMIYEHLIAGSDKRVRWHWPISFQSDRGDDSIAVAKAKPPMTLAEYIALGSQFPDWAPEPERVEVEPQGWRFMAGVIERNVHDLPNLVTASNLKAILHVGATPPRLLIGGVFFNASIFRLRVRSVTGVIKLMDITLSGVVNGEIPLDDLELASRDLNAQHSNEFYVIAKIGHQITLDRINQVIESAENPEWDVYGLRINVYSDDYEFADVELQVRDASRGLASRFPARPKRVES